MSRARRSGARTAPRPPAPAPARAPSACALGLGQPDVGTPEQHQAACHRFAVTDQDEHDQLGTRMRPHWPQVAASSGGRAKDLLDLPTTARDGSRRSGCPPAAPHPCPSAGPAASRSGPPVRSAAPLPPPLRDPDRLGQGGVDFHPALCHLAPEFGRLRLERVHLLAQRGQLGVDRVLAPSIATSSSSSSSARRSVRWRTSSFMAWRSRPDELVAAYIRFSMPLRRSLMLPICSSEILLRPGQHAAPRRLRRPAPLRARPAGVRGRRGPTTRRARRAGAGAA